MKRKRSNSKSRESPWINVVSVVLVVALSLGSVGLISNLFDSNGSTSGTKNQFVNNDVDEDALAVLGQTTRTTGKYYAEEGAQIYTFDSADEVTFASSDVVLNGNADNSNIWLTSVSLGEDVALEYGKDAAKNSLFYLENKMETTGDVYIAEMDIMWCGSNAGVTSEATEYWAVKFGLGNSSSASIDTACFLRFFIYVDENDGLYRITTKYNAPGNEVYLEENGWYNVRAEYYVDTNEYVLFVNDSPIESGVYSYVMDDTVYTRMYVQERSMLYDGVLYLDNTYISAKTN